MRDETIKKDPNKVFRTFTKGTQKSVDKGEMNVAEWRPRNNSVLLEGKMIKRSSGLVLPGKQENSGDLYAFYIYKVGQHAEDLKSEIGKAVILKDYSEVALQPIQVSADKEQIYCHTYEHNIMMVEE